MKIDFVALAPQIQAAEMLVNLGLTTVEAIRGYFRSKVGDDDKVLDQIMSEVNARLARREAGPSYPAEGGE